MIEPRTPLIEFIQDITEILDEAQIEWLDKNKGYYIFKERTQLKELTLNQCKCPPLESRSGLQPNII